MKKILYYLSNIILGVYIILYIPIQSVVPDYGNSSLGILYSGMYINENMRKISLTVIVVSCILKSIFSSKRIEVKDSEKKNSTIAFIIEILVILYMGTIFAFA